ncbi:MFS transporter [Mumia sp. zg.B53]|uniref:MFS transporter n=1 Tax=Mumia sp. zg.B53 TaxID=2855449 RepID=UPI001C6EF742|nr:MFS transporter [Mumia sp. zg.B53]MBW9214742.1 MFS transporter [Mumia sp. zg.B53]
MISTARRTHYRVTLAVLCVGVASFALVQSLTIPVLPRIQEELGTNATTVTWVVTAYLVSASVFTPLAGRLGDATGKERVLVYALGLLAVGSVVAALAPNVGVMIAARVIQGVGGGVVPLAFGIIRDEFPEPKISGAISFTSALMGAGGGFGTVVAGPMVDGLGYVWLFWLPAIVTGAAAVAAWVLVPASPVRTPGRIPLLPTLLFAGWLTALLIGISEGSRVGWGAPLVVGLLVAAVVLLLGWVYVEQRAAVPFIDLRMMRLPAVWTANLVAFLMGVGMYASFAFTPRLLQTDPSVAGYGFGASITQSGLLMLPSAVGTFVMGLVTAPLTRIRGPKPVVVIGCLLSAIGLGAMGLVHHEPWQTAIASGLFGIGLGAVFACLASLVVAAVPPEQTGVASGMNANIRTIGGAVGSAVMATIVTGQLGRGGEPRESSYVAGFLFLSAALLVAALVALLIPKMSRRELEGGLDVDREPEPALAD